MGHLNIYVDNQLEEEVLGVCEHLGIDINTAIILFLRQMVKEQGIPFAISLEPNQTTLDAINDAETGRNLSRKFISISELMDDLNS